jgi:hypothetical protein
MKNSIAQSLEEKKKSLDTVDFIVLLLFFLSLTFLCEIGSLLGTQCFAFHTQTVYFVVQLCRRNKVLGDG